MYGGRLAELSVPTWVIVGIRKTNTRPIFSNSGTESEGDEELAVEWESGLRDCITRC